jgi:hypothetical protein
MLQRPNDAIYSTEQKSVGCKIDLVIEVTNGPFFLLRLFLLAIHDQLKKHATYFHALP